MRYWKPTELLTKWKKIFKEDDEIVIISNWQIDWVLINRQLWEKLTELWYIKQARIELWSEIINNNINNNSFYNTTIMKPVILQNHDKDNNIEMVEYDNEWYNQFWYNKEWFNKEWYNKYWYNTNWYNSEWYDIHWYNSEWYDEKWEDPNWFMEWEQIYNRDWELDQEKSMINKIKRYKKLWLNMYWRTKEEQTKFDNQPKEFA